jgi:Prp8 binding protein
MNILHDNISHYMNQSVNSLSSPQVSNDILLSGHNGAVYTIKFSPDGTVLASGSHDKSIFLWRICSTDCENFMVLDGHKNAVLEVHWSQDGARLISCSPDCSVRSWDASTGVQLKKMEHSSFVNSCCPQGRRSTLIAGGDDAGWIKIWDLRVKQPVLSLLNTCPVTAVSFADVENEIFSGGTDNAVKVWDIRNCETKFELLGHKDTVTGLCVSPDGTLLLSNSMDSTLRVWDIRPYTTKTDSLNIMTGHLHTFEKNLLRCNWSPDGSHISAGSGDHMTCIWEVASKKAFYKMPGHSGSVNEVIFHPKQHLIGSCSSDKQIYLRETSFLDLA